MHGVPQTRGNSGGRHATHPVDNGIFEALFGLSLIVSLLANLIQFPAKLAERFDHDGELTQFGFSPSSYVHWC